MVTETEAPTFLDFNIPGCDPVRFWGSDLTSEKAWRRIQKGFPYLRERDFAARGQFEKYWLVSAGLVAGAVMVSGLERSGKSLWVSHLAYQSKKHFGKRCTLNYKPKKGFGEFDYLDNEGLIQEIDNLRRITGLANDLTEDDEVSPEVEEELRNCLLYNRIFVVDEAYQELDKGRRTNLTRAYGRLVRQWGHLHSLFVFVSPDAEDFDVRMIWKRRTHEVKTTYYRGQCYYNILWKTHGIVKTQQLNPANWGHLWNSWNLVGGGTSLKVKLGGEEPKVRGN